MLTHRQAGIALHTAAALMPGALSADTPLTARLVADGFDYHIFVTSDPSDAGRLIVVEREGRLRLVERGRVRREPFLDITDRVVSDGGERGLFTVAFHPRYQTTGSLYVNYTNPDTVVSRFSITADPDRADPDSEFALLQIAQPHENHNGGCIQFGPLDGYLYIGTGDGGSPGNRFNGQDPSTLLGKMLRLDVDAPPPHVPPDNPFVGDGDPLDEIWALGLRNPWRFAFDAATGDLYIADVGEHLWEEMSVQPGASRGGENYGWSCYEGEAWTGDCEDKPADYVGPVWTYPTPEGCAIIGGPVYRGAAVPDLAGTYFYADLCNDRVFSFRYPDGEVTDFRDRTEELTPVSGTMDRIVSFGQDTTGEIYIVSRQDNAVFKITADFRRTHGDVNDDCRLDLADAAHLMNCFSGDGNSEPPGGPCSRDEFGFLDLDDDADVDLADYARLASELAGPSVCLEGCWSQTCR